MEDEFGLARVGLDGGNLQSQATEGKGNGLNLGPQQGGRS